MTEDEVKSVVKLYWDILHKAVEEVTGQEIPYDGHKVASQDVINVFITPSGTLAATLEYGSPVTVAFLPVPLEAVTCG